MLVFGPGLLATSGAAHKKQRKMLNPVFSGAHMRNLTPIFHEVSRKVRGLNSFRRPSDTLHAAAEARHRDARERWARNVGHRGVDGKDRS